MPKKLEKDFKGEMVDAVFADGGYGTRIEDQFRVGFPDLVLSLPSTGLVIVEAKIFTGNQFKPRDRQYIEMTRINGGGGKTAIVGVKDRRHYFHFNSLVCGIDNCIAQEEGETFCDVFRRYIRSYYG